MAVSPQQVRASPGTWEQSRKPVPCVTFSQRRRKKASQLRICKPRLRGLCCRSAEISRHDEAKALIDELKKPGASFDKVAKEKSTDKASGAEGGDLGWFKKTDMVPEFANAAFADMVGHSRERVMLLKFHEILPAARLSPLKLTSQITEEEWSRLFRAI